MKDIKTIFLDEEKAKNLQLQSGIYAIASGVNPSAHFEFGIQLRSIALLNLEYYNNFITPTADLLRTLFGHTYVLTDAYISKAAYEKLASDKENEFVKKVIAGEQVVVIMRGIDEQHSVPLTSTKFNLLKKLGLIDNAVYMFMVSDESKATQVYWLCTPGPALE